MSNVPLSEDKTASSPSHPKTRSSNLASPIRHPTSPISYHSLLLAICYLLPAIFLILFYFYPLASIFALSFAPESRLELSALQTLTTSSYYLKTAWFTVWQATLSTLLTLTLALPGAYVFARYQFKGKSLLMAVTTIPFVLPTLVVAAAFTSLLGPRGLVNETLMALFQLDTPSVELQHTVSVILLAHIFYNYTIVLRLVGGFWANLDPRIAEAGQMLGATPWQTFRHVTLPMLAPAIGAAALLVFIFCFTSFGVVLILGGPRYATLEVEIYRQAVHLFNLPVGAALAIIQMGFIFVLMLVYARLQARTSRPLSLQSQQVVQRAPKTWGQYLLVYGNIAFMVILLGLPLMALVVRSLTVAGRFSLAYYVALFAGASQRQNLFFVPPTEGITNSLMFAAGTVIMATGLGLLVTLALSRRSMNNYHLAFNKNSTNPSTPTENNRHSSLFKIQNPKSLFDAIFMLPLATSAVTLGFGYIIALDEPPLNLRTSLLLVVIAHTLVALPFVIRSLLPALRSIQPALRETAAILGASPFRVWREVDFPITRRALLVGAVFAFTISMGEFGATLFIARPDTPTMPVAIFRLLGQPGALNYGQALAMSTLLMLVSATGFLSIERFRVGNSEF